ncbi:MAG: Holliday junction branch migration protein RuvA [Acidobacteria bacterium]|nr:Holliday junction branch migration protein RuvA [Acidobacteriota bacterium]
MIAHLSGRLIDKHATSVVLDVGGVGYEVTIPVTTFYELEEAGQTVSLHIYTHVREDALQLFGFKTLRERELFTLLISVSGIGPKSAIAMLSGMNADEIITAIRQNNLARLTSRAAASPSKTSCAAASARSRRVEAGRPRRREGAARHGS